MTVHIAPISADDEPALRAWFEIEVAASAVDRPSDPAPTWAEICGALTAPRPGRVTSAWLATLGGEPAGIAVMELTTRDNLATAPVKIVVAPAHRRRGVGRALLRLLGERARDNGRVRLFGEVISPSASDSAGAVFADAAGGVRGHVEIQRHLEFADVDADSWARLAAEAERPGYTIVRWAGDTPDEWLDDVALMETRMSTDAPQGELHRTAEVHDADSVRQRDEMCRTRGITLLTAAAVAPDGSMAGYTEIGLFDPGTAQAQTWNTLVAAAHRGQRLGMRLKLANLAYLREQFPGVRSISTWNAHDNPHMIAINEALGFRARARLLVYELELPQAGSSGSISATAVGP